ncbi:MAG: DUF523 and DUF1722 domain-containing protein [Candidatus Omnitrophica bacterium]|nr:DUF523 and DUF1722 domain-containing protein [Candidatus Omnitrophota bacterium]MCM8776967.1 DUF523 and DUF1722 domain-containing protein [Candidatus Omnitrophota bacterium]
MFIKPKIVLSRCFSEPVRYNGEIVNNDFVNKLKRYVDYIDFCPELEIGLGVPRKEITIVDENGSKKLIQIKTGIDLTEKFLRYSEKVVNSIKGVDGFLFKSKSPSCGVGSAKIFKNKLLIGKTYGFFSEKVKEKFYYLPVEDEGRLRDGQIREHFLIRIFAFAELRELIKNPDSKKLVDFHTKYKYLLMTYSQKYLKELGQLVAKGDIDIDEKSVIYKKKFYTAFLKRPSPKKHVNTLMHIFGYVSDKLNQKEKEHILNLIENFGKENTQLKVIIEILKGLSYRFENEYLLYQKYLEPYPEELSE